MLFLLFSLLWLIVSHDLIVDEKSPKTSMVSAVSSLPTGATVHGSVTSASNNNNNNNGNTNNTNGSSNVDRKPKIWSLADIAIKDKPEMMASSAAAAAMEIRQATADWYPSALGLPQLGTANPLYKANLSSNLRTNLTKLRPYTSIDILTSGREKAADTL